MLQLPITQLHYRLAKEFGWPPKTVQQLTMAQANLYLECLETETEKKRTT